MRVFRLEPSEPALVLAPHLQYPTRDGADISLDRVARCLSLHLPHVDLVGMNTLTRFESGRVISTQRFDNRIRSRPAGALRTLFRGSHYLLERFLTPHFRREAQSRLLDPQYGLVLFSYISTASLHLRAPEHGRNRLLLVWTHNDQIKWFRNLRESLHNPVLKLVARRSEQWYHRFFSRHRDDFLYLYVTKEDFEGHTRSLGPHSGMVVPIGADVQDSPLPPEYDASSEPSVRLLFVGSLSARMNLDALLHFSARFLPTLRAKMGDRLDVVVAGSSPGQEVVDLCNRMNWTLQPDVTDDELARLYARSSYALLPFPYSTGAKLKLLGALAHGVPFLASAQVRVQLDGVPPHCVVSDRPEDWLSQIEAEPHPDPEIRRTLCETARNYDWEHVVHRMVSDLTKGVSSLKSRV